MRNQALALTLSIAVALCSSCKKTAAPEPGPRGEQAHAEPSRVALQGKLADRPFRLLLERTGSAQTGVLQRVDGVPLQLSGQAEPPKVSLAEQGAPGEQVARIEGQTKADGSLEGTFTGRDGKALPLTATANTPFEGAPDFDRSFAGNIGDEQVRVRLQKKGAALTGSLSWLRDVSLESALSGTVDVQSGAFTLDEKQADGAQAQLQGTVLSPLLIVGSRRAGDKPAQPLLLQPSQASPPTVSLGGGLKLVATGRFSRAAPGCNVDVVWPDMVGVAPEVRSKLEAALRDRASAGVEEGKKCGAPEEGPQELQTATYAIGAFSTRAVAVELQRTEYQGGAHPKSSTDCVVADLKEGALIEPAKLVAKSKELAALATKALQKQTGKSDLTRIGFSSKIVPIEKAQLCVRAGKVMITFNALAIGPNALGAPSVELPVKEVAPLLRANEALATLLR